MSFTNKLFVFCLFIILTYFHVTGDGNLGDYSFRPVKMTTNSSNSEDFENENSNSSEVMVINLQTGFSTTDHRHFELKKMMCPIGFERKDDRCIGITPRIKIY